MLWKVDVGIKQAIHVLTFWRFEKCRPFHANDYHSIAQFPNLKARVNWTRWEYGWMSTADQKGIPWRWEGFLHLFGRTVHMQINVSREKSVCHKKNWKHPLADVCFWSREYWVNCNLPHLCPSWPYFSQKAALPISQTTESYHSIFLGIQYHYWKFAFSWWGNEWTSEREVTWVFHLWLSLVPETEPGPIFAGGRSVSYLYAEGWVKPGTLASDILFSTHKKSTSSANVWCSYLLLGSPAIPVTDFHLCVLSASAAWSPGHLQWCIWN